MGFNYRNSGTNTVKSNEYEGEVLYQPNNRLINGKFGYRDDNLSKNKFIGDVDIEYILTNNGKFLLKAYNHTIDRYTLHSAQYIQGGLLYKESFNSWNELIKHYWKQKLMKQKMRNNQPQTIALNKILSLLLLFLWVLFQCFKRKVSIRYLLICRMIYRRR